MQEQLPGQNRKLNNGIRAAILIGTICTISYFAGYYIRKLLGAVRPSILEEGTYSGVAMDNFQSVYMILYALGQLVNGVLGDYIKPKRMIAMGFLLAGVSTFGFSVTDRVWVSCVCFATLGFALSMLRGPMMKVITENNSPAYARVICVFFRFGSHFALPLAGVFVSLFDWRQAYTVSAAIMIGFAILNYVSILLMERRGMVVPLASEDGTNKRLTLREIGGIFRLPAMWFYLLIAGLSETANTTIIYWFPSYAVQALGQSEATANFATSVYGIVTAASSFLILFLLRLFRGNVRNIMRMTFLLALAAFTGIFIGVGSVGNLVLILVAVFMMVYSGSLIWTVYIPGVGKSGKVSGANGVIDCTGYLIATAANYLFSYLMVSTGWNGMILAWGALALAGLILTLFKSKVGTVFE